MAPPQSLWRGIRTAVAALLTAGLSVAAFYSWFLYKQKSPKDEESKRKEGESSRIKEDALLEGDEEEVEEEEEKISPQTQEEEKSPSKDKDTKKEKSKQDLKKEKDDVVKASGDNDIQKKNREKLPVPSELEITPTKTVDNHEEKPSQPEEKSPEIPLIKSLRIDSTDKKRVLVLGLDRAGKSTFVSALCGRQVQADYVPTQGFAVVTTTIGNKALNFWEVGGALNLRQHWDHYIEGTQVLVYIIDSSSLDTVNVAKVELLSLVEANKHLETIPWLIIASKQDIPGAMNPEELRESLNIPQVPKKPEKLVIGMELPAKGLKKGISQIKNYFTLTDF